jgi:hypothetical protein
MSIVAKVFFAIMDDDVDDDVDDDDDGGKR